ncbi:MAG: helix-turn-helix domain-containing protein [Bacteroidota bacterium]
MNRRDIGKLIKKQMIDQDFNQKQLAEKSGLSDQTIRSACGAGERVGYGAYCKIADALGIVIALDTR